MDLYNRLTITIGNKNINKLKNTKVLLIGLGGVGGSCFESLIRNSIGTIYVCDFDVFEESNINRQTLSNINNIGKYKTNEAFYFAKKINPNIKVILINKRITKENIDLILPMDVNYIIDACDDTNVKIELVKFSIKNNIKIISSMGTGNKTKPEFLELTNIWKTSYDPLAKKIRYLMKKEKINYKLPVVSSIEKPVKKTNNVIGSCSLVPNCAGILLASYVINDMIENE